MNIYGTRTVADLRRQTAKILSRLRLGEQGGVLIYAGILMPVLLGFAGLSIDVSAWYAFKRQSQNIVDAAATGGALEVQRSAGGLTQELVRAAAMVNADRNGYDTGSGHAITINWPPVSGNYRNNRSYVEAIDTKTTQSWLGQIFHPNAVLVGSRAVAGIRGGDACIYALNPSMRSAIKISGTASVDINCGLYVNSNDPEAMTKSGDSCLSATGSAIVGGFNGDDSDCIDHVPAESMPVMPDPLAGLPEPTVAGCDETHNINANNGETINLTPGVYCGNFIKTTGTGRINFAPGEYIFDGTGLDIGGQSTVTGSEVFIFMTEENATNDNFKIAGGATVDLSAPTSGPYEGILFYHDRQGDDDITHQLAGGSNMSLDGIIYAPSQGVKFAGGSDLSGTDNAMLVADHIDFVGNSVLGGFSDVLTGLNNLDHVSLVE